MKIRRILTIGSGILISVIPVIYFILLLMEEFGVPIKTNADGSTEYLMISTAQQNGEPIPLWFMSIWGLVGLLIIVIGIRMAKNKKREF